MSHNKRYVGLPLSVWPDYVYYVCGVLKVGVYRWGNTIVKSYGKAMTDKWFDNIDRFSEDVARVCLDGKWNFMTKEGRIISPKWFENCTSFQNGYAIVETENGWNHIGMDGNLVSDRNWDWCSTFSINGYAVFNSGPFVNHIDTKGVLVSSQWWEWAGDFSDNGLCTVRHHGAYRIINRNGEFVD